MKNSPSILLIMQELQSVKSELSELKALLLNQTVKPEIPTPETTYTEPIEDLLTPKPIENFDYKITVLLKELGIPPHFKGFQFLRYGIKLVYQDPKYLAVTKLLYPEVAKHFNSTYGKVERAIRYAIEVSWAKHRFHPFYTYYESKPTNAEFVADLADGFKLEEITELAVVGES